jgi:hypothetical protein
MSHATVFGGTCTLIGTSTNLVISGLQEAKYGTKNPENVFGFFTITPWGVPYAIWGEYPDVSGLQSTHMNNNQTACRPWPQRDWLQHSVHQLL